MKKIIIICMLIAFGFAFAGCKTTNEAGQRIYKPELVQHIKGSIFEVTERGYYTAELVTKPRQPVVGKNSGQLIIHDYKATDRPGLGIKADLFKQGGTEPIESNIKFEDAGRGLYLMELEIPEAGMLEIRMVISGPEETDKVVLPLPEVR